MPIIKLPTHCIVVVAIFSGRKRTKALNGIKRAYEFVKQNYSIKETNYLQYLDARGFGFFDVLLVSSSSTTSSSVSSGVGKTSSSTKHVSFIAINKDEKDTRLQDIENLKQNDMILFTECHLTKEEQNLFKNKIQINDVDNVESLIETIKTKISTI